MAAGLAQGSVRPMKWIDIPPAWLALFLLLAGGQAALFPVLELGRGFRTIGGVLALAGIAVILLAGVEFRRHKTTLIPHEAPSVMVQSGIYRWSRNPIYLGDVLLLVGLSLRWDSLLGLFAVPLFAWILTRRFILPEEARLRAAFGDAFETYEAQVRRWI